MNIQRSSPAWGQDALKILKVFDRLEIGPVRVEPRRLIMPYRLFYESTETGTELIYKYEEKVFNPREPASRNLAGMIGAQLALNYGLFCRNMLFHGDFDPADRRFIRDMAENTAGEIYVKKFLEPNLFLTGPAKNLPVILQKTYCRAQIEFTGDSERISPQSKPWDPRQNAHCILSSGGKDSLLSYGLINEMGRELHPVYVNESGRHWFTAVNAYRYFKENIPNTARVWVNSDRVFLWFRRQMPFIRKDFARLRTDEYPIRLWTVAVFLFGVLPILRKRGIGRLIIGDEYDTSRRKNYRGIAHYDGLYDQSLWFDRAVSRFFEQKGWGIRQFSLLRPLSEFLIQRILAKRYPYLLARQISCHAAHKEGDMMKPCGRCEKCRRIVGILSAVGEDPKTCGYSESRIASCLKSLSEKGAYTQEQAELNQLFHLLLEKGLIDLPPSVQQSVKHCPETLCLRFDDRVSPMEEIPGDLRKELFQIYLQYAEGSVRKKGKQWERFSLDATE
jgi:hypothetical protein